MPNPWIILATVLSLIGAATGGYFKGRADVQARWDIARLEASNQAQEQLAAANAKTVAKEREYQTLKDKVEADALEAQKRIDGLRIANGRLVAAHGGLFDKNGKPVPASQLPANSNTAGSTDTTASGCRLSDKVADDLLSLAYDADRAATYANACRAWVLSVRP